MPAPDQRRLPVRSGIARTQTGALTRPARRERPDKVKFPAEQLMVG